MILSAEKFGLANQNIN